MGIDSKLLRSAAAMLHVAAVLLFTACSKAGSTRTVVQTQANAQRVIVGGGCEGCEAAETYTGNLTDVDTLPGWHTGKQKMIVTGVVYKPDGHTPASGVVIYLYHTNEAGLYAAAPGATGWAQRHGDMRGWVRTGESGNYKFYTCRPAPYPNARIPAHMHPTVLEPGLTPYYIDDVEFEDDALLTAAARAKLPGRGGPGVVHVNRDNEGVQYVMRNIILGKNIPNHPGNNARK